MKIRNRVLIFVLLISVLMFGCGRKWKNEVNSDEEIVESSKSVGTEKGERGIITIIPFFEEDDVSPSAFLSFQSPCEWKIVEEKGNYVLDSLPIKSRHDILNSSKERIGCVGFNNYSATNTFTNDPLIIYKKLLEDGNRNYDFKTSYQVVNKTYEGNVAVIDILHSIGEKVEEKRYGILAYNRALQLFTFFEFDPTKVKKETIEKIAKSVKIK